MESHPALPTAPALDATVRSPTPASSPSSPAGSPVLGCGPPTDDFLRLLSSAVIALPPTGDRPAPGLPLDVACSEIASEIVSPIPIDLPPLACTTRAAVQDVETEYDSRSSNALISAEPPSPAPTEPAFPLAQESPRSKKAIWKARVIWFFSGKKRVAYLLIVVAIVAALIYLGVSGMLSAGLMAVVRGVRGLGAWGAVLMVVTYWILASFLIPITMLHLASGYLFGLPIGILVSSFGVMCPASTSFLIARRWAPAWIHSRLDRWKYFCVLDDALQYGQTTRQHVESAGLVALVRLPPLFPWSFINYLMGITKVSFLPYFIGTYLGLIPTVGAEVYMGSLLSDLSEVSNSNPTTFLAVAIAVTIVVTVMITIIARRKLGQMKDALDLRNAQASAARDEAAADRRHTATLENLV